MHDFVAKALGTEEKAKQLWKQYYQRVDQLKAALGDRYQDKEISIFGFSSQWGFWIMVKNSFCGSIVHDVGLKRPQAQNVETESGYVNFTSAEQLDMIDGDIIFVLASSEEDKKAFEKSITEPLSKKLKAVQQRRIFFIDDALAWNGATFIATDVVLDDLEKYLVNTPKGQS
ncbi:ABC transporter substrate-binding protein [Leptolyngbya sp. AN03gr2]|uniref:ABC transporter substrate-binding protein n=1 Tax=unclassified Leptolyngbya TaxID=2650499 RepID=UPI003D31A4DA